MTQNRTKALCPCCGGLPAFFYNIERFDPPFDIRRCPDCGLEMQAELPVDVADFYKAGYYSGEAQFSYRDERDYVRFDDYVHQARLKNIARFVPPPADFLDVGCAFGGFTAAAESFGYRARGIDISAHAVSEGRRRGLDLRCGALEEGIIEKSSVDVLTMIEVIEHLSDPVAVFQALSDAIRPGGLLVIQTANYCGRQARKAGKDYHYYLPGHLYYYSTKNLRRFLNDRGFKRIRFYRPTDFGLLPKLLKSRGNFKRPSDYLNWLRIAAYHFKSRIALGDFALTSSMVAYAQKEG